MGSPSTLVNFTDKSMWNAAYSAINNCNVASIGEVNTIFAGLGIPAGEAPVYGSQADLGKRIILTEYGATLAPWYYSGGAAIYGAVYQLVQLSASATVSGKVAAGRGAFSLVDTVANNQGYVVTDESHAAALPELCGVFLNTPTVGYYCFIAVHGRVPVQYKATVTATTAGSALILTGDGTGSFDAPTQSGNPTFLQLAQWLGTAIENPANGALTTARMGILRGRY